MVSWACFLCTSGVSNETTEIEIDEVDEIHKHIDESYMTFVNEQRMLIPNLRIS